jgi:mRNA interferase RelE/StbE
MAITDDAYRAHRAFTTAKTKVDQLAAATLAPVVGQTIAEKEQTTTAHQFFERVRLPTGDLLLSSGRSAAKEIADLSKAECQRVVAKIQLLASYPRPHGCEKLSAAEKYRIRQGDYRILCEINDSTKLVIVVKVANRKEVYR